MMKQASQEQFICEAIEPVEGTFDTHAMMRGEPGLPNRLIWREKEYTVIKVLEQWKESGHCKSGSSEIYLRKHWFKIRCNNDIKMILYFERQPRNNRKSKKRWWLYTIKGIPYE